MTISVVIPTHNAARFIRPTLSSVLGQTFGDLEVIVVDDGSSDATARIVDELRDPRLRLVTGDCRGVSAARNEGIRRTHGERIAFMDHDDLWEPDKLRRQSVMMDSDPRLALVFTQARVEGGSAPEEIFPLLTDPVSFLGSAHENLIHWNYIPMSSVMIRADTVAGLDGPFDTRYALSEDWDLWLRIVSRLGPGGVGFIPEPLTRYRIVAGRATERMADLRLEDIAILENQLREHPWLARSDPARLRDTLYRVHEEAAYWLLKEGRSRESRRLLRAAWALRPLSFKPLRYLVSSYLGVGGKDPADAPGQGQPCA